MVCFKDRVVLVTGGTGGLGKAVVERLLNANALVHIPIYANEELTHFEQRDHERVRLHEGIDLGVEQDVQQLFAKVPDLFASIHLAGGFEMGKLTDTTFDSWDSLMRLNATTCFLCCREAVRSMAGRSGRIVNVAAKPALVPSEHMTAYAASKAAVSAITLSLAEEVRASSIWVNAIVPSIIDTPANRVAMPDADYDAWPKPKEIAETVAFLASPDNTTTRGALVPVYGQS